MRRTRRLRAAHPCALQLLDLTHFCPPDRRQCQPLPPPIVGPRLQFQRQARGPIRQRPISGAPTASAYGLRSLSPASCARTRTYRRSRTPAPGGNLLISSPPCGLPPAPACRVIRTGARQNPGPQSTGPSCGAGPPRVIWGPRLRPRGVSGSVAWEAGETTCRCCWTGHYASNEIRQLALKVGGEPVGPPLRPRQTSGEDARKLDKRRTTGARRFRRLQELRRIFSRLETRAGSFPGFLVFALICDALRQWEHALGDAAAAQTHSAPTPPPPILAGIRPAAVMFSSPQGRGPSPEKERSRMGSR